MTHTSHNKLISFIWSIADDCLRDVYVRGKYRDIILPFVVLRCIDSLLEPTKDAVLEELRYQKENISAVDVDSKGLQDASGFVFYNTSTWTMEKLKGTATNSQQKLVANFEEYLNGFSANVKEIIEKFNLSSQIRHMASKDVLLDVLEKFTSPYINLTPVEKNDPEGRPLPALSNLGMGYVFEELIRKFNEENNEEAGEHFTPREVIQLMTTLVFEPIKDHLPNIITIYDPACGSGGMLTESENYLIEDSMLGRWRFPTENFNNFFFPIPPLSEQEAIVSYLEQETGKIDQAIAQRQEQIEKLKAYKQSLINEVVTGKVKVA